MDTKPTSQFEQAAAGQPESNLLLELWDFIRHNKKRWLLPLLVILLLHALLLLLSSNAAAPFLYPLF
jgi:hypothetical protein